MNSLDMESIKVEHNDWSEHETDLSSDVEHTLPCGESSDFTSPPVQAYSSDFLEHKICLNQSSRVTQYAPINRKTENDVQELSMSEQFSKQKDEQNNEGTFVIVIKPESTVYDNSQDECTVKNTFEIQPQHINECQTGPPENDPNSTLREIAELLNRHSSDVEPSVTQETSDKAITAHACHVCDAVLSCQSSLKRHMTIHTGGRPFVCPTCGKSFSEAGTLTKHIRMHTGERPFECPICEKSFRRSGNVKTHLRTHTEEPPYVCKTCDEGFIIIADLMKHFKSHTESDNKASTAHTCKICDAVFSYQSGLKIHMRSHTGERPFVCPTCNKSFSVSSTLTKHIRTHTGERPFTCPTCEKNFREAGSLKKHLRTHTGERPFVCPTCDKSFSAYGNLKEHMKTHTGKRPFACRVCAKRFSASELLESHLKTHSECELYDRNSVMATTKVEERVLKLEYSESESELKDSPPHNELAQCEGEPVKSEVKVSSDHHRYFPSSIPTTSIPPSSTITCPPPPTTIMAKCEFQTIRDPRVCTYEQNIDLDNSCLVVIKPEIDDSVSDSNKIVCTETCHVGTNQVTASHSQESNLAPRNIGRQSKDVTYNSDNTECNQSVDLKGHSITHTGNKPYVCPTCDKRFKQSSSLAVHRRTHTGERPYVCPTCGKRFGQSSHLQIHLITHTEIKPYVCPTCDKKFKQSSSLTSHLRTHTGERPFVCPTCGKRFSQSSHLQTHLRTHTGIKPYVCPTCDKGFSESSGLKIHIRTHTGERPFVCPTCNKGFCDSRTLNRHQQTHTGE